MKQIRRFLKTGDFYELHVVLSVERVSFLPSASARSLTGQGRDVFIKKSDHLSPENGPRFTEKKKRFPLRETTQPSETRGKCPNCTGVDPAAQEKNAAAVCGPVKCAQFMSDSATHLLKSRVPPMKPAM